MHDEEVEIESQRSEQYKRASKKTGTQISVAGLEDQVGRARSVSVGTSFGGVVEISMRSHGGYYVWAPMQPIEIVELINQLSASIGCHINIKPRNDFASWREWNHSDEELAHYRGFQELPGEGQPPHPNDMAPHAQIGANIPEPTKQAGLKLNKEPAWVEKSHDVSDEQLKKQEASNG